MKTLVICCLVLGSLVFRAPQNDSADKILGIWMTESGKAKVEIFKSGETFYGKIVWLKNQLDESGNHKVDKHNPDPAKRSQKLVGLLLLKSFTHDGENTWKGGTIYDPENGKEYQCKITMNEDGSLNIRGYIGVSLIGRTSVWKKA